MKDKKRKQKKGKNKRRKVNKGKEEGMRDKK